VKATSIAGMVMAGLNWIATRMPQMISVIPHILGTLGPISGNLRTSGHGVQPLLAERAVGELDCKRPFSTQNLPFRFRPIAVISQPDCRSRNCEASIAP